MTQIFYYSAPWCGPCRTFGPLVDKVSHDSDVPIVKINIDDPSMLLQAMEHNIKVVPTLVKVRDNTPIARREGALSEESLRTFVEA